MPLFKTRSAAVYGIDAHLIDVEVDMYASGNPRDSVTVGMPDVAVRESRERIRSAIMNSGFRYPNKAFTINLAPANVRKEGAGFDLPMAIGILGAMGEVRALDRPIFIGELSLDGALSLPPLELRCQRIGIALQLPSGGARGAPGHVRPNYWEFSAKEWDAPTRRSAPIAWLTFDSVAYPRRPDRNWTGARYPNAARKHDPAAAAFAGRPDGSCAL